uniref:Uncharacterized protein n=1 Tax=Arundo donax TaxID=35708 RepID=A0A0A9EEU6_ARUDO
MWSKRPQILPPYAFDITPPYNKRNNNSTNQSNRDIP